MQAIRDWLNSPGNYEQGVKLYLNYGTNDALKRVLKNEAETAFKRSALREALMQLATAATKPNPIKLVTDIRSHAQAQHAPLPKDGWPAHPIEDITVAALHTRWKPLFAEMKNMQARIDEVAEQGAGDPNKALEAGKMALRILELEEQIHEIYYQRDFYYSNGALPSVITPNDAGPVVDPKRWAIEMENARKLVSKLKKKLQASPTNRNAAKWAESMKAAQQRYDHFKNLIADNE